MTQFTEVFAYHQAVFSLKYDDVPVQVSHLMEIPMQYKSGY